jgi:hypothetical protein
MQHHLNTILETMEDGLYYLRMCNNARAYGRACLIMGLYALGIMLQLLLLPLAIIADCVAWIVKHLPW